MTYGFELVPEQGELRLDNRGFEKVSYLLREFSPRPRLTLIGSQSSRIRVLAQGTPVEVAPGILSRSRLLPE